MLLKIGQQQNTYPNIDLKRSWLVKNELSGPSWTSNFSLFFWLLPPIVKILNIQLRTSMPSIKLNCGKWTYLIPPSILIFSFRAPKDGVQQDGSLCGDLTKSEWCSLYKILCVIIIWPLGVYKGMSQMQTFSSLCFTIRHFRRFVNWLSVWSSCFAISCYWTVLLWIVTTGTEIIWSISIAIRIVHLINFVTKTQVIGLIFFRIRYNLNRKFMNDS